MKVSGDLDLQGNKLRNITLDNASAFPVNPKVGSFLMLNKRVMVCVEAGNRPLWVPLTKELDLVDYYQPTAGIEWTIDHELNSNRVLVQIFDMQGNVIIPDEIDCGQRNRVRVKFATPQAGTALLQLGEATGLPKPDIAFTGNYAGLVWNVFHNLGYYPIVDCIVNGALAQPQSIVNDDYGNLTITWNEDTTGLVRCI